jgi:hypothetical protein
MPTADEIEDTRVIRELVENWAVWRDALMWDRFRTVWHDDGRMMATWFQGSADEFIRVSQDGYARGVRILHFLGGSAIDVVAARAVAQTKMTISQRARVENVLCDVVCTGRFYDFFEKRDGRWGLVLRQPIYEKDRLDPVDPAARLELDPVLLVQFPDGYRHRLQGEDRHARPRRPRGRGALPPRRELARGRGTGVRGGGHLSRILLWRSRDVIPGRAFARTRNPGGGAGCEALWIPGSPLPRRPGMTAKNVTPRSWRNPPRRASRCGCR